MSYFKRFTDFCGGFVAFAAALHLIGEYMTFKLPEDELTAGKLKVFLDVERAEGYRGYVIMAALFVLSVIIGRIFERLPYVTLAVSLLPLYQTVNLFAGGKIEKFPILYLLLAILHTAGSIIHALVLDKADGKRRGFICAGVLGAMMSAGGVWVWRKAGELLVYEDPLAVEGLSKTEIQIAVAAQDGAHTLVLNIALMIAVSTLVSLILRDIYFIDAILSVVPLVYAVNKVLLHKQIVIFEELTLILCTLYFVTRVALVAFEPMRATKKLVRSDEALEGTSTEAAQ